MLKSVEYFNKKFKEVEQDNLEELAKDDAGSSDSEDEKTRQSKNNKKGNTPDAKGKTRTQ